MSVWIFLSKMTSSRQVQSVIFGEIFLRLKEVIMRDQNWQFLFFLSPDWFIKFYILTKIWWSRRRLSKKARVRSCIFIHLNIFILNKSQSTQPLLMLLSVLSFCLALLNKKKLFRINIAILTYKLSLVDIWVQFGKNLWCILSSCFDFRTFFEWAKKSPPFLSDFHFWICVLKPPQSDKSRLSLMLKAHQQLKVRLHYVTKPCDVGHMTVWSLLIMG